MKHHFKGMEKLNLEPAQAEYMVECVNAGKNWFVTRRRSRGRCIQSSGESRERVQRTYDGWPGSSLIEIKDGTVVWHKGKRPEDGK